MVRCAQIVGLSMRHCYLRPHLIAPNLPGRTEDEIRGRAGPTPVAHSRPQTLLPPRIQTNKSMGIASLTDAQSRILTNKSMGIASLTDAQSSLRALVLCPSGLKRLAQREVDEVDGVEYLTGLERAEDSFVRAVTYALTCLLRTSPPDASHEAADEFKESVHARYVSELDAPSRATTDSFRVQLYNLLKHLVKLVEINSACLVSMVVLVERAVRAGVPFRIVTARKLVLASLLTATKTFFDEKVSAAEFIKALALGRPAGVRHEDYSSIRHEVLMAERTLICRVLDFNVGIDAKAYEMYNKQLGSLECQLSSDAS